MISPSNPFHEDSNPFDLHVKRGSEHISVYQALESLIQMGFKEAAAKESLNKTNDLDETVKELSATSVLLFTKGLDCSGTWSAPITTRIGSWMPYMDQKTGEQYTVYYVTVSLLAKNKSYQVLKRYSQFYEFYISIYNDLIMHYGDKDMTNTFPDNRYKGWFNGETDELKNMRRERLHLWLREICLNTVFMLNQSSRSKVFEFLEVSKYTSAV